MKNLPTLPLVLRPSRTKLVVLFLICMVFTIVGVMMVRSGDRVGYFCAGVFALGLPIFAATLLPGAAYLRLTDEGFTYCSLFRAHTTRWADVEEFGVIAVGLTRMVGWNFIPGRKAVALSSTSKALAGFEAALPDTYGMKAAELAELMAVIASLYGARENGGASKLDGSFQPQFLTAEFPAGQQAGQPDDTRKS